MNKKTGYMTKDVKDTLADIDMAKGIVVSYPSTFDTVDAGRERVKKGAFARTIKSWGPLGKMRTKVLFDHKPFHLIGRPLELSEDSKGLRAVSQISQTSLGKDILTLINDRVITEQSIGYDLVRQEKAKDGVLDILEVKLYEYSFLAWGMNEDTPIIDLKGFDPKAEESVVEQMKRMEKALHDGTFETEEIPFMLELALKQWADKFPVETPGVERIVVPEDEPEDEKALEFDEALTAVTEARDMWRKFDDISAAHNNSLYDTIFYDGGEPEGRLKTLKKSLKQYSAAVEAWATKFMGFEEKGDATSIRTVVDYGEEENLDTKAIKDAILFLQSLAQGDSGEPTHADADSVDESKDSGNDAHSEELEQFMIDLKELNAESEKASVKDELTKFFEELGL